MSSCAPDGDSLLSDAQVSGGSVPRGLTCLCFVAASHRIQIDPHNLVQVLGLGVKTTSSQDILLAAKHIGLRARARPIGKRHLSKIRLPAVLLLDDQQYLVLVRLHEGKAIVFDPEQPKSPVTLDRKIIEANIRGKAIELRPRLQLSSVPQKFGLSWLVSPVLRYPAVLGEILAASMVLQIFGLAMPLFSQVLIDKVLMHRSVSTLHVLGTGMVFLIFFEAVLSILRTHLLTSTANRVDVILGARVMNHLLHLPLRYFESRRVGNTVAKIRELESIRQFITGASLTSVVDLLFTIVFLGVMLHYSIALTGVVIAAFPLLIGLSFILRPLMRSRLEKRSECGSEAQSLLLETVTGIHTIKALAAERIIQKKWEHALASQVSASFKAADLSGINSALNHLVQRSTILAVLWVGADLVMRGEISVGQMIAFQMLTLRVTHPMVRVAQTWQDFQQVNLSVEELGKVMNAPPEVDAGQGRKLSCSIGGTVVLNKVVFRYSDSTPPILNGLSLVAKPGQVIGIVGRSGCGKSTLVKLIQRLYLPETGTILIDGLDVRHYDPSCLRQQVGVVPQDIFLFNGSIRDNICMYRPDADFNAVMEAAQAACAHEFITTFSQGYDTIVGERGGVLLSGGQRQRIAIARALYAKPRVLILDEATSALDHHSERLVQDNLRRVCMSSTVFVIAHRLSTVRQADKILVLDEGRFIEEGSHADLMANQGFYHKLYLHQEAVVHAGQNA